MAHVPIPFSVFPSAYRNAEHKESTSVQVESEVKVEEQASYGREGHEETHEAFSASVHPPPPHDTHVKEEIRIFEEERLRRPQQPPQHREEVHIHEETRYRQPQRPQQQQQQFQESQRFQETEQVQTRQPPQQPTQRPQQQAQRFDRVEFEASRNSHHPQPPSTTHIEVQDRTYDRHFNTVHGPATDYAPSQIDVTERQFRERTRPIVADSGYSHETFTAKHDSTRRPVENVVDSRYPSEVRVEKTTRSTAAAPKKYKRDMGYYDNEGQYHSFRDGLHKAAHKVGDRLAHPIHPHRHHHHHTSEHSHAGSKYEDVREEIVVKEKYTTSPSAAHSAAPSRSAHSAAPVEKVVRVHASSSAAPAPAPAARQTTSSFTAASAPARAPARKMSNLNTITIPCHHIRIGDLLILQGRPCQVIRITTSSQTGQHRYLGVDLFTKQLHEESSFISNPAPSVVVQNMLGPVFKQYRVLDIREDGRVVAMTEGGDVKQGLPVLDQSGLLARLTESFDNGRGSVRILVINDDGLEMAVDYKVVHGSRL
ncbi:hypothetical protein T440DRAFT_515488 [Plenodomus tracheiphilus IPT5]|uniref:Translation initiation factor 5A-like N-terminal domain-containing protein n=1 Tax=Plenodomus tracheiphilus IPT5 TaxID=1408161 RepID=A0A6A7BHY5_9PLEO|nr:hypothetical protein T440DRAFT_515488 [Plenodomus tracheiphilus IPT5]